VTDHAQSILAAEYVRMSTEHQKYSTENQSEVIRRYADQRGIRIVRTYADHGKSGLRVDGRDALQQLITDVRNRTAGFLVILVYDVSRWGRFQDADESAYYEFICKEAGITVHYCAEQFENDGSLSATIIKGMKRAMAGEYSRELSTKVFAGQCRLITLGFRQGGPAGFGLRRQLIDDQRHPKGELAVGARKSLQTDRVILVPGPQYEVQTVRRMYHMFVDGQSEREIADTLNGEGLRTDRSRPWTRGTVHQVLTNEKYVGDNVYNRMSFKLKKRRVRNPPEMWIRADAAFTPIVQPTLFDAVRRIVEDRAQRFSNDELLGRLAILWKATGWLSGLIIDERDDMPSSSVYRTRFGSLIKAYQLVGFSPGRDYDYIEINRVLRRLHREVMDETVQAITASGGVVQVDPETDLLLVNDEFTTSVVVARCLTTATGLRRWKLRLDTSLRPDITLGIRMDGENHLPLDYYLLPRIDVPYPTLRLAESNGFWLDAYRFDALEAFVDLAARTRLRGTAA
jgi:DNA invertase Pin-like site-specific DNA recombinase